MQKKQSVLLGLREKLEKTFGNMLDDFLSKFKNKQEIFLGADRTYTPVDGFADDPAKRGFKKVSSTVTEQLDWLKKYSLDYFNTVLSIEKTNSTGIKAKLIVNGIEWGEYSVLELLRLKSIMDGKLRAILGELPIRDEKSVWKKTTRDLYGQRDVWETPLVEGYAKTTLKRTEIVNDPHIKEAPNRPPVPVQIETQVNIGHWTEQKFSGEITDIQKAEILVKYDQVYNGIVEALENCNNIESHPSDLGKRFLEYIF
jgi:hypothetical protein